MRWKASPAVGLLVALAVGCVRVPPQSVALDRFDYGQAIADSWKRQTLANIVRLRYGDAPTFLEITSVIRTGSGILLKVDGCLTAARLPTLESTVATLEKPFAVDLSDLHASDEEGIEALRKLRDEGADLQGLSPLIALRLGARQ